MKLSHKIVILSILALTAVELFTPLHPGFISDAQAIIGRPLTPLSYAGVARRTAYRATAYTAAAVAVAATPTVVVAAPVAASVMAVGTMVSQLPSGCTTTVANGVQYFYCGSTYYRAAYQSGELVYVVSAP